MSRTSSKITQADIARVLRAIAQTGAPVEIVIEPDGRIRIVPAQDCQVDSLPKTEPQPKSWN